MVDVPENVHQEFVKLIPTAILSDIVCFVFYDNHPLDQKKLDIAVCTKNGEVKEFFQRDLQCSLNLNCVIKKPTELRILRNENSELFYLLANKDELFIISRKENLRIHKKLTNVDRFDVNDTTCIGETCLKVIRKDDAVPLLFDNNFESLANPMITHKQSGDDSLPLLTELKRKLVEARYSAKCNEKTYVQYLNLHQKVSLLACQNLQPVSNSSIFGNVSKSKSDVLKLITSKPWVKVCNKKIIIMLIGLIEFEKSLENIEILLNNPTILSSLVYTTKLFTRIATSPYWLETDMHKYKPNQECGIVAVMNLDEIKLNITSRIDLSGSISYKISNQEYLLPFDDVVVSSLESMGDEFDALSSYKENDHHMILAVLATTEKTDLCLRHIRHRNEPEISILDLFCTYLQMERVGSTNNVIVYKKSPYHALNGTLLVFHERNSDSENVILVSVHTRTNSQVLSLLHYIYDAVPARIVATIPTYKITAKTDEFSHYNEDTQNIHKDLYYMNYATSILNRSSKILEHLDNSMIKMSESKNPLVLNKVGSHIDLFAGGASSIKELKQSLLEEGKKGIESLNKSGNIDYDTESNVMVID